MTHVSIGSAQAHAKAQALVPRQRRASTATTMLNQAAPGEPGASTESASIFQLPSRMDLEESLPWQDKSAIRWDYVNC